MTWWIRRRTPPPAVASSALPPGWANDLHAHLGRRVSDVDLDKLLAFHRSHGKLATVTAVRPPARFGHLELRRRPGRPVRREAPDERGLDQRRLLRAGAACFDYIDGDDTQWEREPLERLARTASSWPTGTNPSGSAWTRCGTRSCWRSFGGRLSALEDSGADMRVLVTGHSGYIGTVLVPMLQERGHEVPAWIPTTSGAACSPASFPRCEASPRTSATRCSRCGRIRGHHPPGRTVQRPVWGTTGRTSPRISTRRRPSSWRGWRRRRACSASCSPPLAATTGPAVRTFWTRAPIQSGDALRSLQGQGRGRASRTGGYAIFSHVSACLHRLRRLAPAALRSGDQQPYRLGLHHGPGVPEERRYPLAPVVHVEDIAWSYIAALEAPRETVHDRGLQRGHHHGELPDPRAGGDRQGHRSRLPHRVRPGRGTRQALLPGGLQPIARELHGFKPQWTARRGWSSSTRSTSRWA